MFSKIISKLSLGLLLYIAVISFSYSDCTSDGLALTNTSDGTHTASCSSDISMGNSTASILLSNYPSRLSGSATLGDTINTINTTNISLGNSAYGIYANSYPSIVSSSASIGAISNTITTGNISAGISSYGVKFNNYGGIYGGTGSIGNTSNTISTGNISLGNTSSGIEFFNYSGAVSGAGSLGNTTNIISTGNISTGNDSYGVKFLNYPAALSGSVGNINNTVSTNNITTGNDSYGIQFWNYPAIANAGSFGNINNTFSVNGNISTGNNSSSISLKNYPGINSGSGSFGTITNTFNINGNISTGANSYGIYLFNNPTNTGGTGSFGEITNTINLIGNITTAGNNSLGIFFDNYGTSSSNTFNMTGNITTSGTDADGIYLYNLAGTGNTNAVNMTGNVTTSGANAEGIILYNNSNGSSNITLTNTVNMTGNVSTSGANAKAIYLVNTNYGSNNTMTNILNISGRISATGSSGYAIYAGNATSTYTNIVQLNKGSSVIGAIDVVLPVGINKLNLNLGAGASYSFATTGFTVTDLNGRPMVTGSAHAAGVGNITTASQSLYERTSQITQSLDDRLRTHDLKQQPSQDFWVNTYYSDSGRGGQGLSGSNLSFNQYRSGITAGFNVKNSYTPTELIVNYEHGKLNIDEGNQGISSNSVMAGALFPDIKKLFTGTLSAKAMVGYSDFSGDRKVLTNDVAFNGSRNVTANYQSTHLTIGSAWTKTLYQTDKMILDTLVGIDLNTQHINSYSESDLFKWNSRTINQLQERVTLGMEIKPLVKPLTLFGRVGIERRDLISGENQNYAINNTAVSYNDSNQRNTYATLNAGAYYPLTQTVKAYAQVRYYDSVKDIDALSGSIGISGQF